MHSSNMVEIDFITKATPGVIWTLKANGIFLWFGYSANKTPSLFPDFSSTEE